MRPSMSQSPSSRKKPSQVTRRVCKCCRPTGGESGMVNPLVSFGDRRSGRLYGDRRHDAQLGDSRALALQNLEPEAVERIDLADLGNATGLMQDEACNRGGDIL